MIVNDTYKPNNGKISIIGAGFVGSNIAYALMLMEYADMIVLIDSNFEKAASEVLDIRHGLPYAKSAHIHCGQFSDIADSDLIIVTSGRNRHANESRLDMTQDNLIIAETVACEIKKNYTKGLIMIISNPVDIVTYKMTQWLKLDKGMVFGSGCMLDVSRFSSILAEYLHAAPGSVSACIVGEHGESQVVLWNEITVEGLPVEDYCSRVNLSLDITVKRRIEQQVIDMGTAIIRGKNRTHYGVTTCACHIADAILNGRDIMACVSSALDGEYGLNGIALSLPCLINRAGVSIVSGKAIYAEEYEKLHSSATKIRAVLERI